MITKKIPTHWKELQGWVAQILTECGYKIEVEKVVQTARGTVEIDVYAIEVVDGRDYITICECKNWSARIPQHVIHSFRSVVSDVGAHIGYIVAPSGFQSGSNRAVEYTNIKLVSWEDFQSYFQETWIRNYFVKKITQSLDPLISYLEPIPAMVHWDCYLTRYEVAELSKLFQENMTFGALLLGFHSAVYGFLQRPKITLPLRKNMEQNQAEWEGIPPAMLDETGYRELLQKMIDYGTPLLMRFQDYRDIAFSRRDAVGK